MAGQGRPHRRPSAPRGAPGRILLTALIIASLAQIPRAATGQPLVVEQPQRPAAPPSNPALSIEQPVSPPHDRASDLRLRIAFGGGAPRLWRGSISISQGQFSQPRLLGLEPDEPGSMELGVQTIQIRQRSPRSYDGLDVSIHAPLDAELRLRLAAADATDAPRDFRFKLAELVSGAHPAANDAAGRLDALGNRLVIARAPGDLVRVNFEHKSLVFTPGESFRFTVSPQLLGVETGATLRMKLHVAARLTGEEYFAREQDVKVADDGTVAPWGPHEFVVPEGDGVYELVVMINRRGRFDTLPAAGTITAGKLVAQRRLQFVAVAADPPATERAREELVDEFDPISPNWSQRVARLPLLKRLPRMSKGQLSHGAVRVIEHGGRKWTELAADAWQAHSLSIDHPGTPHVLEVEYPSDLPQTLGVSVVEPNAVGDVGPMGLDTAVRVTPPAAGEKFSLARQRVVFWPRTRTPVLLLVSHDSQRPAVYGRVRISRIHGRLSPRLAASAIMADERMIAAWLDKPLLAEMFSATDARDPVLARSFDDWQTFYEASDRFTQYLSHAGYNTAVIPAVCEGGSIYPSELLQPTAKYDTGVFLSDGQDPLQKDTLELLLRMFDRGGLKLTPSVQFNAPLPELEQLLRGLPRDAVGLELVDHQGRTWNQRHAAAGGLGVYYNPLDERVQAAMIRVVGELAERYSEHPALAALVLQLSPRGYAMLPGGGWGFDDRTFARFAAAAKIEDPGVGRDRFAQRARWCSTQGRELWLAWRSSQMTSFYQQMAAEVRRARPDLRLILAGPDLLDGDALRQALRPTLAATASSEHAIRAALWELGLDPARLAKDPAISLIPPYPCVPSAGPLGEEDWDEAALEQLRTQLQASGTMFYREPATMRLATFDAASPFGKDHTHAWLAAQVSPAGSGNRRRWIEALAHQEQVMLIDGGWMLPRGQEESLAGVLATLRQLPGEKLVSSSSTPATQPVVVRRHSDDRRTIAYVLNNSPWPVQARLRVTAAATPRVYALVDGVKIPGVETASGQSSWTLDLEPYALVGATFDQPNVELAVEHVRLPEELEPALAARLSDVRRRAAGLKSPTPKLLEINADFEQLLRDGEIPGWLYPRGEEFEVTLAQPGHRGSQGALRVVSRGPEVWVRSQPLVAPKTGRIAVWARVRTPDAAHQPELRLAIEARRDGQPYYRFANVGAGVPAAPLADRWAPFILQIDDLPRHGLNEFRIGFDLMGPGEVWIDDVEVFDLSFTDKEQFQIARLIAVADFHLDPKRTNLAAAAQVLDGYWPRFLLEHVAPAPAEAAPLTSQPASTIPQPTNPPAEPPKQSMIDRARDWFRWPF